MWSLFKLNVLRALKSGRYGKDIESFANFYASEYDKCIKRGGDLLHGVPVINGNVVGMAGVIKRALEKGAKQNGENFNLLKEIFPAAVDAYWNGAEMAPIPNPLLRPAGWVATPPAPGAILNISPSPIALAQSAAKQAAIKAAVKGVVDSLKSQKINIPKIGEVNVGETIEKIKKGERVDNEIKNHPAVKAAKTIDAKYEQIKKMKPGTGMQFKPAIKIPFPELPKRMKLIEAARKQLQETAVKTLEQQYKNAAKEIIANALTSELSRQAPLVDQNAIKNYVKSKIEGQTPASPLPPEIPQPNIPTGEELEKQIKDKIPNPEELKSMAAFLILDKIPKIPNVFFIPPAKKFTPATNILVDPFVNLAKIHLLSTGGNIMVMAQYPPPAPPAPAVIQWTGYSVMSGPPIPNLPSPPSLPNIPSLPSLPSIPGIPSAPSLPTPNR